MKVPFAKKWQKESDKLRAIALDCDVVEEGKWGKPCFTYQQKNVAIIIPLKESCALSFFKGALLKDPKHILQMVGEHTQAARWVKLTSVRQIAALRTTLKTYLYEAVLVEESEKKVPRKKVAEYAFPAELQARLDADPVAGVAPLCLPAKSARKAAKFRRAARPREANSARPLRSAAPAWGRGAPKPA